MNYEHHEHEWIVYSTALVTPVIMVRCKTCKVKGIIKDFSDHEWREAFDASSKNYPWTDNSRVLINRDNKIKMDKIDWNGEYWKNLHLFDENFLSFHFDHSSFDKDSWQELIDKWKLKTKINTEREIISVYNDDYSIVLTGNNDDNIPDMFFILTFNENIITEKLIKFTKELISALSDYDEPIVDIGMTSQFTRHPKDILLKMIENL